MAATPAPKQRAPRRRLSPAEKRRIVELTLCEGASLPAIAREHGVHPNSIGQWKALYLAGKLDTPLNPTSRVSGSAASATFVPVSVVAEVRRAQSAASSHFSTARSGVMQFVLASGATLRIETSALDAAFVCAVVAELKR